MIRRYLAAPKVGLVAEDDLKSGRYLADRQANGEAFDGERVVRLPRRLFRRQARDLRWPGFWALKREIAGTAR